MCQATCLTKGSSDYTFSWQACQKDTYQVDVIELALVGIMCNMHAFSVLKVSFWLREQAEQLKSMSNRAGKMQLRANRQLMLMMLLKTPLISMYPQK